MFAQRSSLSKPYRVITACIDRMKSGKLRHKTTEIAKELLESGEPEKAIRRLAGGVKDYHKSAV